MVQLHCHDFSERTDFHGFWRDASSKTSGDLSLLEACKPEVCEALWGSGNPDISGIGMAVGYLLESIICASLICVHMGLMLRRKWYTKTARSLLTRASETFFDNAIFFAFAIQIASIITLARANFGISAEGMGAITMKIAWVVSTLTLLPLLPLVLRSELFEDADCKTLAGEMDEDSRNSSKVESEVTQRARCEQRFLMFVICWALSFYPFYSCMVGTFGEKQIGDSPEAAISTKEWVSIERMCFEHVKSIGTGREATMTAFGVASWMFVTTIVIYKIVLSAMKDQYERQLVWLRQRHLTFDETTARGVHMWLSVCLFTCVLIIVQFWTFFRLRRFHSDMTEAAGGSFPDGQWSFGQIVALSVFLPVVVEILVLWKRRFI